MAIPIKTISVLSVLVLALVAPNTTTAETTHDSQLTISVPDQLDIFIERLAFQESSGRENIDIHRHQRQALARLPPVPKMRPSRGSRRSTSLKGIVFNCSFAKRTYPPGPTS